MHKLSMIMIKISINLKTRSPLLSRVVNMNLYVLADLVEARRKVEVE